MALACLLLGSFSWLALGQAAAQAEREDGSTAMPGVSVPTTERSETEWAFIAARDLRQPIYSRVFKDRHGAQVFQVHVPLLSKGQFTGDLVADYSIDVLLRHFVPTEVTRMTCGFCATGCSLDVHLRDGVAIGLTPTPDHPVNLGMACPKGWEALSVLKSDDRATTPLLRDPGEVHGGVVDVFGAGYRHLFQQQIQQWQRESPSEEEVEDTLDRYSELAQNPVIMH